jgi:tRNA nucleotidyltransferase (CCA-adding enzyme)
MTPSPASFPFVRALQQRGARVYTVGGTVRDELLGHPRKDLDLLVTGLPQPDLLHCLRPYGRVQLTGRAFGVIKLLPHGWDGPPIDVALPRTEISTGIGHRDFEVTFDHTLPVETDLGRRDFTINAMAIDLADGHLLDPFGGHEDLQQRRLRQVSMVAFPEDPLRMLRGIQLAARFALQIEPATRESMQTHAAAIATVAPERIAEELRKLLQAWAPSQGFVMMQEVGLLRHIVPELARLADGAAFTRTMRRLDAVQQCERLSYRGDLDLLLTALLCDSGLSAVAQTGTSWTLKDLAQASARLARQRLEALKITTIGATPARISALIAQSAFEVSALATPAALRHFAHEVGCTEAFMLFELRLADRLGNAPEHPVDDLLDLRQRLRMAIDQKTPLSLKELAVNGDDLQRLGIPAGPRLGQILQTLLGQVLDDPAQNTRARLLALAQAERDLPQPRATD